MAKKIDIRSIVELAGAISIVVGLIFVGLQMQQEQELFASENAISVSQIIIERNNSIIENRDIWVSGNKGAILSEEDFAAYERMLNNFNEVTFQRFLSSQTAGSNAGGVPAVAEFAGLLARNPGAYKAWKDREVELAENFRATLGEDFVNQDNIGVRYRALVKEFVEAIIARNQGTPIIL